ncbi:hypothetical protein WN50_23315 [Limnoraphis robusta CS-951]|uniref:Transposase n=1 Tax=Limnoraphis robusta CS-951 TaxID=1637645 RepID=A0A0F5YA74_9CYAN|nr:hypothetical protein WN50_23315 [Limnoraphis robusta CS-951]
MLVYEMKLQGTQYQYRKLDEAIRTGRFVRNSIIKAWINISVLKIPSGRRKSTPPERLISAVAGKPNPCKSTHRKRKPK